MRVAAALLALGLVAAAPPAAPPAGKGLVSATAVPVPGTAQRQAIMDAARAHFRKFVPLDIEFVVHRILVRDGWAFIDVLPRRKDGRPIDGRKYFDQGYKPSDGLGTTALLRFNRGTWTVKDMVTGSADRWYCGEAGPALNKVICP
jgi:hypothetical protein